MEDVTTDRLGLTILDPDECWQLMGSVDIGRVVFVDATGPAALPVTHTVSDRTIVFRSEPGSKLSLVERGRPLAFEVDEWDAATSTGWSVLLRGSSELVADADLARVERRAGRPWVDVAGTGRWARIRPFEVTGRRLA
jgi:nitroimidazol reductase NimA-like FMN-containing flavoprotein (pyridoxamine 5'-phosphate oxidase superfamily)